MPFFGGGFFGFFFFFSFAAETAASSRDRVARTMSASADAYRHPRIDTRVRFPSDFSAARIDAHPSSPSGFPSRKRRSSVPLARSALAVALAAFGPARVAHRSSSLSVPSIANASAIVAHASSPKPFRARLRNSSDLVARIDAATASAAAKSTRFRDRSTYPSASFVSAAARIARAVSTPHSLSARSNTVRVVLSVSARISAAPAASVNPHERRRNSANVDVARAEGSSTRHNAATPRAPGPGLSLQSRRTSLALSIRPCASRSNPISPASLSRRFSDVARAPDFNATPTASTLASPSPACARSHEDIASPRVARVLGTTPRSSHAATYTSRAVVSAE